MPEIALSCVNPETNNILYLRRRESIGKSGEVANEAVKRSRLVYIQMKEDGREKGY